MLSIKALEASERFELVGVADLSQAARAGAVAEGVTAQMFADAAGLLDASRPDVICVSTFAPSHSEIVGQALDAGVRGVLLEKPVALDWASGRATVDRLTARQVPVVVPHGLLVRPASKEVLDHIFEGDLRRFGARRDRMRGLGLDECRCALGGFRFSCLRDDEVQSVFAACDVSSQHISRRYRGGNRGGNLCRYPVRRAACDCRPATTSDRLGPAKIRSTVFTGASAASNSGDGKTVIGSAPAARPARRRRSQ